MCMSERECRNHLLFVGALVAPFAWHLNGWTGSADTGINWNLRSCRWNRVIQPLCSSFFCRRGSTIAAKNLRRVEYTFLRSLSFTISCLVSLVSRVSSAKLTSTVIGTVPHDATRIADLLRHADNLSPLCSTPSSHATSLRNLFASRHRKLTDPQGIRFKQ